LAIGLLAQDAGHIFSTLAEQDVSMSELVPGVRAIVVEREMPRPLERSGALTPAPLIET
jgi:hypothetical protein